MSMPEPFSEVHTLLKASAQMFKEEADKIEDPVLSQAVHWAAAALAMSHMVYDIRVKELI